MFIYLLYKYDAIQYYISNYLNNYNIENKKIDTYDKLFDIIMNYTYDNDKAHDHIYNFLFSFKPCEKNFKYCFNNKENVNVYDFLCNLEIYLNFYNLITKVDFNSLKNCNDFSVAVNNYAITSKYHDMFKSNLNSYDFSKYNEIYDTLKLNFYSKIMI